MEEFEIISAIPLSSNTIQVVVKKDGKLCNVPIPTSFVEQGESAVKALIKEHWDMHNGLAVVPEFLKAKTIKVEDSDSYKEGKK